MADQLDEVEMILTRVRVVYATVDDLFLNEEKKVSLIMGVDDASGCWVKVSFRNWLGEQCLIYISL